MGIKRRAATQVERLHAPKHGIIVRMYRTGLGDCFLLALPRTPTGAEDRRDFYMLIDCGVYFRTPPVIDPDDQQKTIPQEKWIQKIAAHIKASTGGHIDVVTITHEHWDHVSGFHEDQAQDIFGSITIGGLWLAWTEDMSIDLARKLKEQGGADHDTLERAIAEMEKRQGMKDSSPFKMSEKMLGFFGAKSEEPKTSKRKKYSEETGKAMEWIETTWAKNIKPKYFHPGNQTDLPGVDPNHARIYVLGPPEDEKVIKVCDRKGAGYRMGIDRTDVAPCFAAFGVLPTADPDSDINGERTREMNIPFDKRHQRTPTEYKHKTAKLFDEYQKAYTIQLIHSLKSSNDLPKEGADLIILAKVNDLLHIRIFHGGKKIEDTNETTLKKRRTIAKDVDLLNETLENLWTQKHLSTEDEEAIITSLYTIVDLPADNRWRTIDHDWAEPAAAFALQLDSKTNNTSFAFALEIGPPGEGKVLLFPGDAQVGNWLSWFGPVKVLGVKEPVGKVLEWKAGEKTINAEDLMRRTVLYKVGHHGSHNATLRTRDNEPSGLQLMTSKDLVAMIPVDEYVARNKAGYGDMPLPGIVADLIDLTQGRVIRNDEGAKHDKDDAPVLNGVGLFGRTIVDKFDGKSMNDYYIDYEITI